MPGYCNMAIWACEIFFAISGFVIAQSVNGRTRWSFAVARLSRLWPAFLLCFTVTLIAKSQPMTLGEVLANMTMVPRVFGVTAIEGAYWSLLIEIIFYAYVGTLMIGPKFAQRLAIAIPFWLGLASINLLFPVPGKLVLILDWAPYFCIGLSVWLMRQNAPHAVIYWLASVAVSTVAAGMQTRYDPTIAAAVVLCAGLLFPWASQTRPSTRIGMIAGAMSYPIYLLHNQAWKHLTPFIGAWLAAAAVILIAWLVTRIEPHGARAIKRAASLIK